MRRLLLALALLGVTATPASATDRCHRRAGEQLLARSAQATVIAKARFGRQTLTGCSRRSGRRHRIAVLGFQNGGGRTRLVGLRLAGTRIAYVVTNDRPNDAVATEIVADDALHGGRRHAVASLRTGWERLTSWAVDAEGDVAWIAKGDDVPPSLHVWRSGLGRRRVDARADLQDLRLASEELSWRRNGVRHTVDLAAIPLSACTPKATEGTLDIDLYGVDVDHYGSDPVCLRATGRAIPMPDASRGVDLLDLVGPYIVVRWSINAHAGAYLVDAASERITSIDPTPSDPFDQPYGLVDDAVVDEHGSLAWIAEGALWVRDTAGTRMVPGTGSGRFLYRDGSTVTWPGGGPTVTLTP